MHAINMDSFSHSPHMVDIMEFAQEHSTLFTPQQIEDIVEINKNIREVGFLLNGIDKTIENRNTHVVNTKLINLVHEKISQVKEMNDRIETKKKELSPIIMQRLNEHFGLDMQRNGMQADVMMQ